MTTWVLLRGLMREARHWGEFPAQLQAACGAQRVLTPNFAGNGELHRASSAASVAEMTEQLRRQLQQRGLTPPYHVLALSLGAMVAVDWSARYPAELARMALINTSLAPHNPFYQRLRPRNYLHLLAALLHGAPQQREHLILRLTSSQGTHAAALLQQWQAYAQQYPVRRVNILRQLHAALRYRAPAGAPAMPTLLLAGAQDALVDARCSHTLAARWHCPLRLHPGAGHDLPLDDGAWVLRQLQEWR